MILHEELVKHVHDVPLSDDRCTIQVGDTLPSVLLQEGNPKTTVNVKELFAGKKGILFAVPGAFTPGCSKVQH